MSHSLFTEHLPSIRLYSAYYNVDKSTTMEKRNIWKRSMKIIYTVPWTFVWLSRHQNWRPGQSGRSAVQQAFMAGGPSVYKWTFVRVDVTAVKSMTC